MSKWVQEPSLIEPSQKPSQIFFDHSKSSAGFPFSGFDLRSNQDITLQGLLIDLICVSLWAYSRHFTHAFMSVGWHAWSWWERLLSGAMHAFDQQMFGVRLRLSKRKIGHISYFPQSFPPLHQTSAPL